MLKPRDTNNKYEWHASTCFTCGVYRHPTSGHGMLHPWVGHKPLSALTLVFECFNPGPPFECFR